MEEEIIDTTPEEEGGTSYSIIDEIIYNKIYARADESGNVVHIFSQAFEQPQETDICIDATNTDRHGAQKYPVTDENGFFNYEIKNGALQERDKTADVQKAANAARIVELKRLLAASDYKALKYSDGALTAEEYEPIRVQRQAWRDEINNLEAQA